MKFADKKLETPLYRTVWNIFRYPQPFKRRSQVWQMDGQTDRTAFSNK